MKQRYEDHNSDNVFVTGRMMTGFQSTVPNITLDITGKTKRKILSFSDVPGRVITRSGHVFQLATPDEKTEKAFILNAPRLLGQTHDFIRTWYAQLTEHGKSYGIYIHPYYCFRKNTGSSRGFTCGDDSDSEQFDLPAHLFHRLEHWSSKIFLLLTKEGILPKETDVKNNAIGYYGQGYEGLYSIISSEHPECSLYPSILLGNRPQQGKLSISRYFSKYKDWLIQRAYLESNPNTLNIESEMDNFIQGLIYSKQYFKLTQDDRNSREPTIQAKYKQGQIVTTLMSFDSLIDKPSVPAITPPRFANRFGSPRTPSSGPSKFQNGKPPRYGVTPQKINQLISSDYDPTDPTAVVTVPENVSADEILYTRKFCNAIKSLPADENQFCIMIHQLTGSQYDTTKPCAVCSKPGHNFDNCPILNDTKFLKTAWIKVKMFFSKLQRFQADAIDAQISQINAQAIEAGIASPYDTDDDAIEQMDFQ